MPRVSEMTETVFDGVSYPYVPPKALLKPGGKTSLAGLRILDGAKVRPITEISSIARALQGRRMFDWALLVSCPRADVDFVRKAAPRSLLE